MAWPFEEHPEFWVSLDELDQTPETGAIVNKIASNDPRAAAPNAQGVRIIKSRSAVVEGKIYPALKLAYTFDLVDPVTRLQREVVLLVAVRPYDDAAEAFDEDERRSNIS
jgi:hypothetical protein